MSNPADPKAPFRLRHPIRFTHTDPAGYVFFPRYFEMLQATSEDWFTKRLGIEFSDMILNLHLGQPTAHVECEFIRPCVLGDLLDIDLILEGFGRSSLTVRYIGSVSGEVRLRARSVQVLLDMRHGRPAPIEGEFRERFLEYMEAVVPPDDVGPARRG